LALSLGVYCSAVILVVFCTVACAHGVVSVVLASTRRNGASALARIGSQLIMVLGLLAMMARSHLWLLNCCCSSPRSLWPSFRLIVPPAPVLGAARRTNPSRNLLTSSNTCECVASPSAMQMLWMFSLWF